MRQIQKNNSKEIRTEVNESRSGRCRAHNHTNTEMNESRHQQTDQADFRKKSPFVLPHFSSLQLGVDGSLGTTFALTRAGRSVPLSVTSRPSLRGYLGFQIILHLTRRLSRILWKVKEGLGSFWKPLEALGSPWKFMEDLEASCRRFEAMAIETEKNAASGSTVIDENRGRNDLRHQPKKRGTSKDVVVSLDHRVAGVETSMAKLKNQVEGLEGLDSDFTNSFMGEITKIRDEFGDEVSTLHQVIEACKRIWRCASGKREARAVDDLLWEMEQYLERVNVVDDASKIKMATPYLKDTAALWWRCQYGDIERGTATIDTWAEFVADFKKPSIRRMLRTRQRVGFVNSSNPGRYGSTSRNLSTAIAHAEALIDFSTRRESSKLKDRKVNQEKDGGEKNAQLKSSRLPKKASLNGMSAHEDEEVSDGGSMGSIRILNVIKEKMEVPKVVGKGQQYMEATINGVKVRALVDSGATHNFVADDEAKRLGINATKGSGTIKAVNSPAKAIHGVAKDVRAKIGEWEGTIDLSVVLMDDFKVVLGLEFLDKVRAFPMPFANSLCILDGVKTCMVLRDNELYVKLEKCSFAQDEVEFLGHKIKDGGLMMDGAKIKAIQDWEPPTKVTELRSFLALVNYYRMFIMGYSAISSPLTDLLKKNKSWIHVSSKKQDCTVMSTAEAEYLSLSACYAQVIWMRTQLLDYGYKYNRIPMYCDSKSAIAISCNPVKHFKIKNIDIRCHFIKEHVEKGTWKFTLSGQNTNLRIYLLKRFQKNALSIWFIALV
ncbi:putative retrotransposon gag domain, aspartic peptidase domain protein [Tanacetum coccineum]